MKFFLTALLLLSGSSAAVASPSQPSIRQGQLARASDPVAKFTVAVRVASRPDVPSTCSGTLIAENLVLTAAHCIGAGDQIGFGTDLIHSPATRPIVAQAAHPDFRGAGTPHDIGLIRFSGSLPSGYVPMTHLVTAPEVRDGQSIVISGFGARRADGSPGDIGLLRQGKARILHRDFSESEIELEEAGGSGPCYGDSGGPAVTYTPEGTLRLLALASRGEGEHCRGNSIYTRVDSHVGWIRHVADAWNAGKR